MKCLLFCSASYSAVNGKVDVSFTRCVLHKSCLPHSEHVRCAYSHSECWWLWYHLSLLFHLLLLNMPQVTKLRGYDAHLGASLSTKSIDIRKREAEALRARIEREMAAQVGGLKSSNRWRCMQV